MNNSSFGRPAVMAVALVVGTVACGVEERRDFLIGRQCDRNTPEDCDPDQTCVPHEWRGGETFTDFRCRDEASILAPNAPLAYCAPDTRCPGSLVCNADRVRRETSVRPLVCKRRDDLFAPPYDGGI